MQRSKSEQNNYILNAASACVLLAASAMMLYMAGSAQLIPYAIPGAAVFFVWSCISERLDLRRRLTVIAVVLVAVVVVSIVLRSRLADGSAMIINKLFDIAQRSQSYVYFKRYVSEGAEPSYQILAVIWSTIIAGFVAASIPVSLRRTVNIVITISVMLIYAFFGLIPSVIAGVALFASLLLSLTGGSKLNAWPLAAILIIVSAAVLLADPGESKAISKADEMLRDRLSMQTVYIEGGYAPDTEIKNPLQEDKEDEKNEDEDSGGGDGLVKNSKVLIVALLTLVTLMILFIPAFIHDSLERKRKRRRDGIDSEDNAIAIRSMFRYALMWLSVYGIKVDKRDFKDIGKDVRLNMPGSFSDRYNSMIDLWTEAAFSEHTMSEESRKTMNEFMDEAIRITKEKADWKDKFRIRFKYAL